MDKTQGKALAAPALDDQAIAQARAMIGMPIRIEQWNHEASRDVVRHYAWGIGDDNPLWNDPDYAARTRWGGIIASPTFFYGIFDAVVAPGLPDIQWIYSGVDCEFHEPIRRNDEITAHAEYVDARELPARRSGRLLVQTGEVRYTNQHGQLATRVLSHTFRVARLTAEGGLSYPPRAEHRYRAEELAAIEKAILEEYRRGADTLHWEDAEVGQPIPRIVRGPLNRLDMTCYYAGAPGTSGYKSTRLKWLYGHWGRHSPEKLPNNYDASYYAAAISPSIGHQDTEVATTEIGMPGAYDNGPMRIGIMASCLTNWMGDDGFLRRYSVRVKLPVIFGDVYYVDGSVTRKRIEGERGLVDVEVRASNQLGELTAQGSGSIELPRRG